ncbi:MAG: alpha/beta fold hydrolase [Deltaproteobacteria bacterium]|nr:alpha/beta fold hydrolase [Deltaproteobacteria bacterium]
MAHTEHPRFLSWDDTRIAYGVRGEPASDRVCLFVNGLFGTDACWAFLQQDLAMGHRLVTFDLRGHGGSDPPADPAHVTVSDVARDARALLDHLGVERAVLFGTSYGVQVALESWRLFPERIAGLVLITGDYEDPLATFRLLGIPPRAWRTAATTLARLPPRATQATWHAAFRLPIWHALARLARATRTDSSQMRPFYDHQTRIHVPTALRLALAATDHSAEDLLPDVRIPTLVVAGGEDPVTPASRAAALRDAIPGAAWLEVPEGTHTTLMEAPEQVNPRVLEFLSGIRWEDQPPEGGV